ncbi:Translation Initiation Factor 5B [Thelotrema lepadinum]|nr:Translation Initiation Factor 5B [Thelotrema lepadinum]
MPPKKKTNKKANDDWESEVAESVDPIAAATQAAKDEGETSPDAEQGETLGGGLLASLKKNKGKRAKKGKAVQDDFVEGEEIPANDANAANGTDGIDGVASESMPKKEAEEANADDIFAAQATKGKGGKGKQNKQEPKAGNEEDEDKAEAGGVKSKKDKEREKKEREKQRKKELAAKKKTPAPAQKQEQPKVEEPKAETAPEPMPTSAPATAKADAGKKPKKGALAALQKQMEERQKLEQEQAKLAAEEKARLEEEEKLEAERAKKEQEAKARKKEKEKEKKEELRKQGLLLTKAQKEAKQKAELRKEQMLAAGVKVAGLDAPAEKPKPVHDKKKKGAANKRAEEEARLLEAQKAAEAEAQRLTEERERIRLEEEKAKAEAEAAESSEDDDWEAAADKEEHVKESWDADSSEDEDDSKTADGSQANGHAKATPTGTSLPSRPAAKPRAQEESDSESDDSSEDEAKTATRRSAAKKKADAAARRAQQHEEALAAQNKDDLRSPICCILGHVDTGKTKLLDKIRQTNVQEGEAGGITQQIGATFFPREALEAKTSVVNPDNTFEFKVPGLLVIDTPGHESFTNLRSRGSSLCNIAILVVDIMHGLEPQTLESMKLLRDRKTPFIVALNKIDRLYGWKKIDNNGFRNSLELQNKGVQNEFRDRLEKTKLAFAEQGFNAELYYENKSMARFVSLVPTSAHTGEGIPDMLKLLVTLTQERMTNKLMYLSEVECTVLEVKVIEGLGTTIDVVLSNGILREQDRIVLCGLNGAITTNIRALLTPAPMKELRVKGQYVHNDMAKASLGIKIAGDGLEHAIAGSRLLVVGPDDDEEDLEEEVMGDLENLLSRVSKTGRGVSVQASTLGSLEALLEFLRVSKIPVANISIGPVYKRDVMQAGIMLEKSKEYAVMLCFDVKVDKEAQAYADEVGVKVFTADIIYHLFDDFTKHMADLNEKRKEEAKLYAVFPCVLTPITVFNKKDPIVVGVDVTDGQLKISTPIAAIKHNPVTNVKEIVSLGRVTSIERDHKQIPVCKRGQPSVAVKIEGPNQPLYGRQLEEKDTLYSLISRQSIDTLKEFYREEVTKDEWLLVKKMKPLFDIP